MKGVKIFDSDHETLWALKGLLQIEENNKVSLAKVFHRVMVEARVYAKQVVEGV